MQEQASDLPGSAFTLVWRRIANLVHRVRHRWTLQNVRCDQRRGKHKASEMYSKRLALELLQPTIERRVSYLTEGFV